MKIYKVLLIAFACMFSTFALAIPTVAQVEASISKGDYTTAKKQLEEVLAKQPDSMVANKYMMEIIKIEYAKTQTPSVEYKLYENRIATINAALAKEKARLAKIEQDKKDAERKASTAAFFRWMVGIIVTIVVGIMIVFAIRALLETRRKKKRQLQEEADFKAWISDTRAALLDMNKFISSTQEEYDDWETRFPKLRFLLDDTLMYLNDLKNNDFNGHDIDRHFTNAEDYFKQVGLI